MVLRVDSDDVWHWYKIIKSFEESRMPPKRFCDRHGYNYHVFQNRYYRIVWKSKSRPNWYASVVPIGRKYMESGMRASQFCKEHNFDIKALSPLVTHLNYLDVIQLMQDKQESAPMFIQVPSIQTQAPVVHEPEVIRKQNDIELTISAGVKVVVAPEVGADKLVRIIELLKDL